MTNPYHLQLVASPQRRGFSLMEAVVAMAIVGFASSVLLLGVEATLESVEEQEELTIADGLARQLLDEIQGQRWVDLSVTDDPLTTTLAPSSDELSGPGRSTFDDTDDYNNYSSSPPVNPLGLMLSSVDSSGKTLPDSLRIHGSYLTNWRRSVRVAYVNQSNHSVELPDNNPTNYRALICQIHRRNADNTWRLVLERRRIISYVPASQ